MGSNVAIIGAGVAGLAMSVRLSAKGYRVTVFDQRERVGGKLNELRLGQFRFDTGPSLFTLPSLLREVFALAGKEMDDIIPCRKLSSITRYLFPNGKVLNAYANPEEMALEAERVLGEPAENTLLYLKSSENLYNLTAQTFIFSPFPSVKNLFSYSSLMLLLSPKKLRAMETMHGVNAKSFRTPEMVQLFDRYATYNGSNPYLAPGTLTMIPHLEHNVGAFFPQKGMYSIAEGLYGLAKSMGVEFQLSSRVSGIEDNGSKVVGVRVNQESLPFDWVVSDADIFRAYPELMPKHKLKERYSSQSPSSSALIFYWGVRGSFPQLDLHNILFSADYKEEFNALANGQILNDPTVYIFISSKVVEGDAPEGHENWFVMVNAPENREQDWDSIREETRRAIVEKINDTLGLDIEPLIVEEDYLDPLRIESLTGSFKGALYGISSNSPMAAFSRHPNRHSSFKNLIFVGGSVHPGGGIPLCLASTRIADSFFPSKQRL